MTDYATYNPNIRIPNLPNGKIVDENGYPTVEEQTFRQALLTLLQNNIGDAGTAITQQNQANMNTIVENTQITQLPEGAGITNYTCQFGTMFYNTDPPSMSNPGGYGLQVAINDGSGVPVLRTVTIS